MEQSDKWWLNFLLAEAAGARYASEAVDLRASTPCCEANEPTGYGLDATLGDSGRIAEAAQLFLAAKERFQVDSKHWAVATAHAFGTLRLCAEAAKPEWWNDEELKALSAMAVRAAPDGSAANRMRAVVLSGRYGGAWEAGPRSAAALREAAAHYERAAALQPAPLPKAALADAAASCRAEAEAM